MNGPVATEVERGSESSACVEHPGLQARTGSVLRVISEVGRGVVLCSRGRISHVLGPTSCHGACQRPDWDAHSQNTGDLARWRGTHRDNDNNRSSCHLSTRGALCVVEPCSKIQVCICAPARVAERERTCRHKKVSHSSNHCQTAQARYQRLKK